MKLSKIALLLVCVFSLVMAASCGGQKDNIYKGTIKVVYELEGGNYQNCTTKVTRYYYFKGEGNNYIKGLEEISGKEIENPGYVVEGWYKTKNADGTYSEKWDFENDQVTADGVTLYAKWIPEIVYTFETYYKDDSGNEHRIKSYPTVKDGTFKGKIEENNFKDENQNPHTVLSFVDGEGNPWDMETKHPGGDKSTAVKVYVEYIDGDFKLVSTPKELRYASNSNIYLLNDIDFADERNKTLRFHNFSGEFKGNGHTVKNFTIEYSEKNASAEQDIITLDKSSLYISLFGNTKNALIEDVNFENVFVDIKVNNEKIKKVYVSPLIVKAENTTISNVTLNGTFKIKVASHLNGNVFGIEESGKFNPFYTKDEKDTSTATNVVINFTETK